MKRIQDLLRFTNFLVTLIAVFSAGQVAAQNLGPVRIDLSGLWRFRMDTAGVGEKERWMDSLFEASVSLPGTMAEWGRGVLRQQPVTNHLNADWEYSGAAWYQREFQLPRDWQDKSIRLLLERSKATSVWIDGTLIGNSRVLSAAQIFELPAGLDPGSHRLTICVNNSPRLFPVGGAHALSEHTQTNWNGIIGNLYLEARNALHLEGLRLCTDTRERQLFIKFGLSAAPISGTEKIQVRLEGTTETTLAKALCRTLDLDACLRDSGIVLPLTDDIQWWDEYRPAVYRLTVMLRDGAELLDSLQLCTGFRSFEPKGTRFAVNNRLTFLRGKNDCCIFPITGYPPTIVSDWRRLYRIAKQYGINHYRFHSYTPPEAAFEAADLEGIYIQTELPNWSGFSATDSVKEAFQLEEGRAIVAAYGNHPSFVMLSLGNELSGDAQVNERLIGNIKTYDDGRRLYAYGTNSFFMQPHPGRDDDFWVTMRTGKETSDGHYDVRGSFATTEDRSNGILNSQPPNTKRNFSTAIAGWKLPVIGHETGQYQIYPDYRELTAYTGVLKPLNLEIFRQRLQQAGMGDQAHDFFRASGRLAAQLYRREIEMSTGTPGLAGFQLLDLQDFPGQGTALVGLLNAFMQSKGLIRPELFRQSCNDITVQVLMDKYTWTSAETFQAKLQVVNFGSLPLAGKKILWTLADNQSVIARGAAMISQANDPFILPAGAMNVTLSRINTARRLQLHVQIGGTEYTNQYPVWVYPAKQELEVPTTVTVTDQLSSSVLNRLEAGARVVFFPDANAIQEKSVKGQFISEFWNWKVFKEGAMRQQKPVSAGTLGLLVQPSHPVFNDFPTDSFSSWQWWSVARAARPLILDSLPGYKPIVQVIDNIDRNHRLGLLFEFRVGKGCLLVCMAPLQQLDADPAAGQLYRSILHYMNGRLPDPETQITVGQLKKLF